MISKTTVATFTDGGYKGIYDWSGGIPLALGETMTVIKDNEKLVYVVVRKNTTLEGLGTDQSVITEYNLDLQPI